MPFDQAPKPPGQDFVEPRWDLHAYRARPQPSAGKLQNPAHSAHRFAGQRRHHSSDVPGVVGRSLAAVCRISRSMVSSPTLRLKRLSSSSRNASSSLGRARSAFSAPSRKRSRQSSTSASFNPCRRAASAAVVSPLSKLITNAARRLAVQRCTSSALCSSAMYHLDRLVALVLLVARFSRGADTAIDPWQLLEPRRAWAMIVVIAGLGFFNYVMLR